MVAPSQCLLDFDKGSISSLISFSLLIKLNGTLLFEDKIFLNIHNVGLYFILHGDMWVNLDHLIYWTGSTGSNS